MKKMLFILALLLPLAGVAQNTSFGLTGRLGAYETIVSSNRSVGDNNSYGPGLQLEVGAWYRLNLTEKGAVQFTVFQALERQSGGAIMVIDESRNPLADLKTRYGNLAIGATALFFYKHSDKLAIGAGIGAKYNYVAIMVMQELQDRGGNSVGGDDYYDNNYHRKLRVCLPLEAQLALSPRVRLVGQVQVPLSNRITASESAFKERDLGLTLGVNYALY
ncbi:hypothetical protein ACFS7Z_12120 [Pontibacter toksunensis]|uniref:Outer membrane protein beta-barrel domain-containing protein n=1 Tax=Pontibacter toksunensis TaxID=1332631 RepID=A0ABW6BTJ8_9BACT